MLKIFENNLAESIKKETVTYQNVTLMKYMIKLPKV